MAASQNAQKTLRFERNNGSGAVFPNSAVNGQIEALVGEIRATQAQMEALEASVTAKKAILRVLLAALGEQWTDGEGYARLVADYTRGAYDVRALDQLRLNSAWWDARLRRHYRQFAVRGSVVVR